LDAVSTTCGSGWVDDEYATLHSLVDPPATETVSKIGE